MYLIIIYIVHIYARKLYYGLYDIRLHIQYTIIIYIYTIYKASLVTYE